MIEVDNKLLINVCVYLYNVQTTPSHMTEHQTLPDHHNSLTITTQVKSTTGMCTYNKVTWLFSSCVIGQLMTSHRCPPWIPTELIYLPLYHIWTAAYSISSVWQYKGKYPHHLLRNMYGYICLLFFCFLSQLWEQFKIFIKLLAQIGN